MPQIATQTLTIVVNSVLVLTNPSSLPSAVQGQAYSFQLTASGGTTPYSWSASNLPAGLTCSSSGLISGVPSSSGSFSNVIVTCTDNS